MFRARAAWRTWSLREMGAPGASPVAEAGWGSKIEASTPDNFNYPALEMSLQQAHPRAGRTLLDWLPLPITLSRLWMYSHRASSMARALFTEGMAADKGMYFIWDFTQLNVRPHSRVGLLKYKIAPKCSLSGPFRHSGVGRNPGAVRPVRSYNLNFTYPCQGDGREVEVVQAFDGGEAGGADPALHHALVVVDEFQFRETQQVVGMVHILGGEGRLSGRAV